MDRQLDLQQFLECVGDAVFAVNREGVLVLWNKGAERLFGHSSEQAIGQTLDLIVPEESRAAHWQGFRQAIETGTTRLGTDLIRVPALHRAGHTVRIALTVGIVRNESGQIDAIGAIVREETA